MALTGTYSNVRIMVNGDSISEQCIIKSAVLVGGSGTSSASLANADSVKFLDLGSIAASTAVNLHDLDIRINGGDTITASLTGTGAKLYLYLK